MAKLSEQIREARQNVNMTQAAVARALNVSRQTVSHWENGRAKPDARTVRLLSELLKAEFTFPEGEEPVELPRGDAAMSTATPQKDNTDAPASDIPQQGIIDAPASDIPQEETIDAPASDIPQERTIDALASDHLQNDSPAPAQPAAPRRRWPRIALAALVLACVAILAWRLGAGSAKPKVYTSDNGLTYTVEQFLQSAPNAPGNAWLSVEKTMRVEANEGMDLWMYEFAFHEMNGVGATIDSLEMCHFLNDGAKARVLDGEALEQAGLGREIAPGGSWKVTGGLPVQETVTGVGVALHITDDTGAQLTFPCYLELNIK